MARYNVPDDTVWCGTAFEDNMVGESSVADC